MHSRSYIASLLVVLATLLALTEVTHKDCKLKAPIAACGNIGMMHNANCSPTGLLELLSKRVWIELTLSCLLLKTS